MNGVPYIGTVPPAAECVVPPGAAVLAFKYCELCRELFVTAQDEAVAPGDYVSLQRGAGHRNPVVCKRCASSAVDPGFLAAEAQEMQRIARELRAERNAMQKASPLRFPTARRAQQSEEKESRKRARSNWAKWRVPLVEALKAKGALTAREMATIMGVKPDAPASYIYVIPQRVRNVGIDIVVARMETLTHGRRRYFALSSSTTALAAPLTPPQDSVTHQFMRLVSAESASQ